MAHSRHPFDWTVTDSTRLHQAPWLTLREDNCQMPDGTMLDYYVLEFPTWVNVVALTPAQEVVLVRQYRHGIRRTILELPCGCVDPEDASPLDAARRELLEETGHTSETFLQTGRLAPNPARQDNFTHCFVATGSRPVQAPSLDDTEQLETVYMPFKDLLTNIRQGVFFQALHVASVFLALQMLEQLHQPYTAEDL